MWLERPMKCSTPGRYIKGDCTLSQYLSLSMLNMSLSPSVCAIVHLSVSRMSLGVSVCQHVVYFPRSRPDGCKAIFSILTFLTLVFSSFHLSMENQLSTESCSLHMVHYFLDIPESCHFILYYSTQSPCPVSQL